MGQCAAEGTFYAPLIELSIIGDNLVTTGNAMAGNSRP
jgi:hypothetical protein